MIIPKQLFVIGTAVISITACSKKEAPEPEVSHSLPAVEEVEKITIISYEEYFADSVLDKFTEQTGIEINYVPCENTIEMRAYLQSNPGLVDVVITDDVACRELAQIEMIQPLELKKINGMENLDPSFLGLPFDPANQYSVPYLWGTTLIAYRKDWNPSPEKSWNIITDPTSDARVGWINEANDIFGFSLLAKGHDVSTEDPAELEDAAEVMGNYVKARKPMVDGIYEVLDALDAGDLDVVATFSGDAALYAEDNEKIAYFIPEEGASLWLDSFVIASDAPSIEGAYEFINFFLRPEIAAENAQSLWFATPNLAALPHLDQEFLADEGLWPNAETLKRCGFLPNSSHERDVIVSRGMQKVMELIREQHQEPSVVTGPVSGEPETFDPLPVNP